MSDNIDDKMVDKDEESKIEKGDAIKDVNTSEKVSPSISTEVATRKELTATELQALDYTDFSTPARMLTLADVLVGSSLVPLKKREDVVMALMTGKDLGLPFMASITQIYPISGRPTLGVHIQRAILLSNGVIAQKTEDAVSIYEFAELDAEGKAKTIQKNTTEGLKPFPIIVGRGIASEQPPNTGKRKIDSRTTYVFTREIKMKSGNYKELQVTSSFTYGEAVEAKLTEKPVWQQYWRRMLDARAYTNGAREIADDLLLGIMSPSELSSNFYINEKGEEVQEAVIIEEK
jgi:hypothetical protein